MEREKGVVPTHDDQEGAGGARAKLQEPLLGEKLRRGLSVAKRGGTCTPVCPWKLEDDVEEAGPSRGADDSAKAAADAAQNGTQSRRQHRHEGLFPLPDVPSAGAGPALTARKLGAGLWEIQEPPRHRMSRRSAGTRHHKDGKLANLSELSPLGPHEQMTASSPAITLASSLGLKGKSGYSRKMSTELLKILNRIWSLEEQHTSTVSLVKTLKLELEHAEARIQELLQEKQSNRHEIDSLMMQITEDKLTRKSKEHERIKATVQSLSGELENERRLRRHSESLHRRLGKELSEIKSAFSKSMKYLEMEKKARHSLEDLCDEFAKCIGEHERGVREFKQKSEKWCGSNSFISHFAEAWLEERLQMRLAESKSDLSEKNRIMDRLECEVEVFLQEIRSYRLNDDYLFQKEMLKDGCLRRHSLESIHLNGAASAPQYAEEEEDSVASDLHCFELNMSTDAAERHPCLEHNGVQGVEKLEESRNSNMAKEMVGSPERFKYQGSSSSKGKFGGHMLSYNEVKMHLMNKVQGICRHNISEGGEDASQTDVVLCQKFEEGEAREDVWCMKAKLDGTHTSDHIIGNSASVSKFGQICKPEPEGDHAEDRSDKLLSQRSSLTAGREDASGNRHALSSPVQQWNYHHTSPDLPISECSKLPNGKKESTLKAKLVEARLKGRRARLKTSGDHSIGSQ